MRRSVKIGLTVAACCTLAAIALAVVALVVVMGPPPRLPRVASDALDNAEQYEVLSIAPRLPEPDSSGPFRGLSVTGRASDAPDVLRGYRVLGRTSVTDPVVRRRLNEALRDGVRRGPGALCFKPRHGIRVTSSGTRTDLLICFECARSHVWSGEQHDAWTTDGSPQPVFDEVLRSAGVLSAKD